MAWDNALGSDALMDPVLISWETYVQISGRMVASVIALSLSAQAKARQAQDHLPHIYGAWVYVHAITVYVSSCLRSSQPNLISTLR